MLNGRVGDVSTIQAGDVSNGQAGDVRLAMYIQVQTGDVVRLAMSGWRCVHWSS